MFWDLASNRGCAWVRQRILRAGRSIDSLYCLRRTQALHVSSINFSLWENGMNSLTSTSFTAFIGIDWADTKHDVCLQASNNDKREFAVIPHQVDRIEQWA